MDIALLLFLPCILWGMEVRTEGFREDPLDIAGAKVLKGILAVLVMLHHLSRHMDGFFLFFLDNVGVLCVSVFLFLSGYGLQKSYQEKPDYRKSILRRRIPSILVPYLVLTLIYWGFYAICGERWPLWRVLQSFARGNPIAAYSWYILCILAMYGNYWLSTFVAGPGNRGMVLYQLASAMVWVWLCRSLGYSYFWYNAIIAFPGGILWAMEVDRLKPWLQRRYFPALAGSSLVFGAAFPGALYTAGEQGVIVSLFWLAVCAFLVLMLLALMKVSFGNRVLLFLGEISFEIYGIHGLFLRLYRGELLYMENDLHWCLMVMGSSVAAAWVLHRVFRLVLKT